MCHIPQGENDMAQWIEQEAERWEYEQEKERRERFTPPEKEQVHAGNMERHDPTQHASS